MNKSTIAFGLMVLFSSPAMAQMPDLAYQYEMLRLESQIFDLDFKLTMMEIDRINNSRSRRSRSAPRTINAIETKADIRSRAPVMPNNDPQPPNIQYEPIISYLPLR